MARKPTKKDELAAALEAEEADEGVDKKAITDEEVIDGGPLSSTEEDLVEVKIGGQTLRVSQEVADAYSEETGRYTSEIADLKKARPTSTRIETTSRTETKEGEEKPDLTTLIFTEPAKAIDLIKKEMREELTSAYKADQAREKFWTDFYAENPELKGNDSIIYGVMQAHWDDLADLKGKAARDKVAELTRTEVISLSQRLTKKGRDKVVTETLEGGNSSRANKRTASVEDQDQGPVSLTAAIKARRAKRRASADTVH